jgi:glucarate dehydratase
VFGLHGMRRTREMVRVPPRHQHRGVNFEQLAANVLNTAVDVILLDTTFWGGIRACVKAAAVCETFSWAWRSTPRRARDSTRHHAAFGRSASKSFFAADAHNHHLTDDIIEGGLMRYDNGAIAKYRMDRAWA